jgi:hypothetical protein
MNSEIRASLDRAQYMLDTAMKFIERNRLHEFKVHYDEATCDGYCLLSDCEAVRDDLRSVLSFYRESV